MLCRRTNKFLLYMLGHLLFSLLALFFLHGLFVFLSQILVQILSIKKYGVRTFFASLSSNLFPLGVPFSNRLSSSVSSLRSAPPLLVVESLAPMVSSASASLPLDMGTLSAKRFL